MEDESSEKQAPNRLRMKQDFWKGFLYGLVSCVTGMLALLTLLVSNGTVDLKAAVVHGEKTKTTLESQIQAKVSLIENYIEEYFLDEIDPVKMADSVYKGVVDGLGDQYAAYYTEEEYSSIMEKTSGIYCGIGAYVSSDPATGAITIVKPMKDSPAEKAGLKAGDVIYAVDETEVTGKDLSEVLALIKGEEGSELTMKIIRQGESDTLKFTLKRANIEEDTVAAKMFDGGIGYIQVTGFEEITPKQFKQSLKELEKQGLNALMIDLRDNGGGLLDAAVEMLDQLLPRGLVVYTEDSHGIAEEYYAENKDQFDKPLAILVNENSASASEVFSGALQDEKKAKLVGTTTFGKGIVQTIFQLGDGTALKMTTAKYFTPKGRNIHGTGLEPDIPVELNKQSLLQTDENEDWKPDNQMQKAIEYLEGELSGEDDQKK